MGGKVGGVASSFIKPKWEVVSRRGMAKVMEKLFNLPPKKIDARKNLRVNVATAVGVSVENIAASQYQGCGC